MTRVDDLPEDDGKFPSLAESVTPDPPSLEEREEVFSHPEGVLRIGGDAIGRSDMEQFLGWMDEERYKLVSFERASPETRKALKNGKAMVGYGDDFLLKDQLGNKIRCENNTKNRPFDVNWALSIAHDILTGRWRFNGEPIIISKYGQIISGQHRGIALILACQIWGKNPEKYLSVWPTEPVLNTMMVVGVEEDDATLETVDQVKTSSTADVLYKSKVFQQYRGQEKKECSKMMDTCLDVLWERTGMRKIIKYQTHGEVMEFLSNHNTDADNEGLVGYVTWMFGTNAGRGLTKLHLSAGHCAAFSYLFAASATCGEDYRASRCQSAINFSRAQQACQFFTVLVGNDATGGVKLLGLREYIGSIRENREEHIQAKKHAALVYAWNRYVEGGEVTKRWLEEQIEQHLEESGEGEIRFRRPPTCGGIDTGVGDDRDSEIHNPPAEVNGRADKEKESKLRIEELDRAVAIQAHDLSLRDEAAAEAERVRQRMAEKAAKRAAKSEPK